MIPDPLSNKDRRDFEGVIKALVLLLGTEAGGGASRVSLDAVEMDRQNYYELVATRYQDPYRLVLEVVPK
jgi:hypothetical protein